MKEPTLFNENEEDKIASEEAAQLKSVHTNEEVSAPVSNQKNPEFDIFGTGLNGYRG
ncbi:hypothetical protein [Cytobacillus purgationiresistens]|uniref:Uncharacterized protein n=1 Tax=Cytobacillus purgationiresistens TaxID=863449 RepID=A0ABU0AAK3_9BACI|nr:hypothetical protein [Cytobacillus purgationiresistens]MDQ0268287.1 hypothetical protein [Cytobacillus purgationiresistens]